MKVSSFVRSFSLDSPEDTFESWSVTAKHHIATAVSKFIDEVLLLFVQRDEVIVRTPTALIQDLEVNVIDESGCSRCSDRKSTRLNSSHANISYAVFCLKK